MDAQSFAAFNRMRIAPLPQEPFTPRLIVWNRKVCFAHICKRARPCVAAAHGGITGLPRSGSTLLTNREQQ